MSEINQTMFNNLTDIGQLTDNLFSDDFDTDLNSNLNNELNNKLKKDLNGGDDLTNDLMTNDLDELNDNQHMNSLNYQGKFKKEEKEYTKLTTPTLEDSTLNLSLLDHALSEDELYKYLPLFSENNFQFVDDLDIKNTLQPCSSINSNATTVSTQETNEFRESLLNSDFNNEGKNNSQIETVDQFNEKKGFDSNECLNNIQASTNQDSVFSTMEQADTNELSKSDVDNANFNRQQTTSTITSSQLIYSTAKSEFNSLCTITNQSKMMDLNLISQRSNQQQPNDQQPPNQSNNFIGNRLVEYNNQIPVNYYYANSINQKRVNQQISQFPSQFTNNNLQTGFINNCPPNNLVESAMNYYDLSNCNSQFSNNPSNVPSFLNNNEYYTYTECRDLYCPYTYCSRYNPYYNFMQVRNQFKPPNLNENFLTNTSVNMNLIDNQVVFNKQSDQVFASNLIANNQTKTTAKTKRTKRPKQPKNEPTETSVICDESTDYTFYTLEENLQSKKKRGRKRKTNVLELS